MKNNNVLINEEKYKKGLEFIKNKNFRSAEKIFSKTLGMLIILLVKFI